MNKDELKSKTISSLIWKFGERIGNQIMGIIISIVLARLLMPEDYGAVALILVFVSVCDVFLINGLASPLIQKKKADSKDYSTILYTSIVLGTVLYVILYVLSPFIAEFYDTQILCPALRVLGLRVVVSSFASVQNAFIASTLQFKKNFIGSLFGTLSSGIVGIFLAYSGYGIWALVVQQILNPFICMLITFFLIDWKPTLEFSFGRLRSMWKFGSNILVAALINEFYQDFRTILIGKIYTKQDLSFFNQGNTYPRLIVDNVNSSIVSVLFPSIAKVQDDRETVKRFVRRSIKTSSFLLLPLLFGLAVVAEPLISLLLTDKWLPCVPYLQTFSIALCLIPISSASQQAIKALGYSSITMRQELIKKSTGAIIIGVTAFISVDAIVIGAAISELWFFIVNTYPNKRVYNYNYIEQLKDLLPNFLCAFVMVLVIIPIRFMTSSDLCCLLLQVFVGAISYFIVCRLSKNESYVYILNQIKRKYY